MKLSLIIILLVAVGGLAFAFGNDNILRGTFLKNTQTETDELIINNPLDTLEAIDLAEEAKELLEGKSTETIVDENAKENNAPEVTDEDTSMVAVNNDNEPAVETETKTMVVAGGCFWCVEADLEKLTGVIEVVSGYAGGTTENPTYGDYSKNGHREVVEVTYNPQVVTFEELLIYSMKHMDPTDDDGSFGDRGDYYSPAFYYETEEEREIIENLIKEVDENGPYNKPLAIDVEERPKFWPAEDFHQNYYKGTLSQVKYKYYRNASGRDDFIEESWGQDTDPSLPWRSSSIDDKNAPWSNFIKPSEEKLQSALSDIQYKVTQKNGTEKSFNNEYWDNKEDGIYVDIVSGEPLFSSTHKFDSGTGWPSFTRPIEFSYVTEHDDFLLLQLRTEIRSAIADSHLGHVFNDAPEELGGMRYCMNSASLRFIPKAEMETEGYGQFMYLFE